MGDKQNTASTIRLPTNNPPHQGRARVGSTIEYRPTQRGGHHSDLPTPTRPAREGVGVRRVTAVIAWGKRPVPSRTRKLRPTAPMVLHPEGCGRVGHRRTTPQKGRAPAHQSAGAPLINPHPTGPDGPGADAPPVPQPRADLPAAHTDRPPPPRWGPVLVPGPATPPRSGPVPVPVPGGSPGQPRAAPGEPAAGTTPPGPARNNPHRHTDRPLYATGPHQYGGGLCAFRGPRVRRAGDQPTILPGLRWPPGSAAVKRPRRSRTPSGETSCSIHGLCSSPTP